MLLSFCSPDSHLLSHWILPFCAFLGLSLGQLQVVDLACLVAWVLFRHLMPLMPLLLRNPNVFFLVIVLLLLFVPVGNLFCPSLWRLFPSLPSLSYLCLCVPLWVFYSFLFLLVLLDPFPWLMRPTWKITSKNLTTLWDPRACSNSYMYKMSGPSSCSWHVHITLAILACHKQQTNKRKYESFEAFSDCNAAFKFFTFSSASIRRNVLPSLHVDHPALLTFC